MKSPKRVLAIILAVFCTLLLTRNNWVGAGALAPTRTALPSKTPKPTATPKGGLAPTGKIAYVNRDSGELFISNVDGTDPQKLPANVPQWGGFTWSPDGKQIAFATRDGENGIVAQISILDISTSSVHTLPLNGIYPEYLTWSPDGQAITFVNVNYSNNTTEIFSLDPQGGPPTRLFSVDIKADTVLRDLEWSPDGKHFLYDIFPMGNEDKALHIIDLDGKNDHVLFKTAPPGRWEGAPKWSPDGKKIVVEDPASNTTVYRGLIVLDVASGSQKKISLVTPHEVPALYLIGDYDWSPDGQYIVVLGYMGINIVNDDGSNRRVFSTDTEYSLDNVAWQPASAALAAGTPASGTPSQ